jgi:hemolysin activation/secretion protein
LTASVALAQTPPGAADVLRSTQEKAPPPVRDASALPSVRIDERPALNIAGNVKVKVTAFKISGNTAIDSATLEAAVAGDVGKELDGPGLADAAKKVRRAYTARGYFLAVAYLPQQQIKDGVVEIAVIEGRLGEIKVKVAPGTRFSEAFARSILEAHLKPGDLITENSIERPLLLIRDMAGMDARSYIDPGKDFGTANLTVEVTPDKSTPFVNGSVDVDDYGNRFAGEHRLGALVNLNSPLGRGDRLSVRAQVAEQTKTNLGSINYILPVGPYGTKVSASYADLNYKLGKNEQFSALDAHGDATITGVNVVHPFVRRRDANVLVRLGYEEKDTHDYLNTAPVPDHKKVKSAVLEVSGDLFDSYKGYTFGSLGVVSGKAELLTATALASDQISGKTNGDFTKTVWSIARFQQLPADFFVDLSASGQQASKNLTQVEKFALGGPTAVRAYPVGDATGDNGELYSVELRHAVPSLKLFGNHVTASAFYDWGRVEQFANPSDISGGVKDNVLRRSGFGLGLSAGTRDTLLFKMSVAWPDSGSPATGQSDSAKRDPRVYFQALKAF